MWFPLNFERFAQVCFRHLLDIRKESSEACLSETENVLYHSLPGADIYLDSMAIEVPVNVERAMII